MSQYGMQAVDNQEEKRASPDPLPALQGWPVPGEEGQVARESGPVRDYESQVGRAQGQARPSALLHS
jgi:hypothetical protein